VATTRDPRPPGRRAGRRPGTREPAPPDLPDTLRQVDDVDLADEAYLSGLLVSGADLAGRPVDLAEIERCRFAGGSLSGATLSQATLVDCHAGRADWANLHAERSRMRRVEFTGCRLTGMQWTDGVLRDVAFRDCRLDLAGFRFSTLTDVAFTGCVLSRADLTRATLAGVTFDGCDLTGAQFSQVKVESARFARCDLDGAGGIADLRGAVVAADDLIPLAHTLAAALGIVIETG
jgi:uncharacterized protein YjbI with pentapeptide repeats